MISVKRGDKIVSLETFSSKEVREYLDKVLNSEKRRFEILANPKNCQCTLATIDGTSFLIYAYFSTCIEISCNVKDVEKMADVIAALKKWDKFSQTETKHVYSFEDDGTHITIFENAYTSVASYKKRFGNFELSITRF